MFEARHPRKEFGGWSKEDIHEEVADLVAVIEDHVLYGVNVVVPRDIYLSHAAGIKHTKIVNLYFLAAYSSIRSYCRSAKH